MNDVDNYQGLDRNLWVFIFYLKIFITFNYCFHSTNLAIRNASH